MRKESYSLGRQQGRRFNSRSGTLILLLGQSGAGKSHFINTLAGRHLAAVSHGQGSGDLEVHDHIIEDPSPSGSRLILVDTPGWDNLYITDDKIMKKIKEWLDEQCDADVKVGGVLFLQDITGDRPNIPPEWPVKFLSGAVMRRLFLVTTKWDLSRSWFDGPAEAKQREAAKVEAWKELLQKGAQLRRFENNERSAWGVLNELLKSDPLDLGTLVKGLDQMGAAIKKALRPTNSDFKSSSAHRIIGFLGRLTP